MFQISDKIQFKTVEEFTQSQPPFLRASEGDITLQKQFQNKIGVITKFNDDLCRFCYIKFNNDDVVQPHPGYFHINRLKKLNGLQLSKNDVLL